MQNLKIIFVLVLVAFMVSGSTVATVASAHKKSSDSTSSSSNPPPQPTRACMAS
jgi:flagellar basal body-associated protein FliL